MNYRIGQYNHLKSSELEDTNRFIEVVNSDIQAKPYKISTSSDSEDNGISTIDRTEKCIKLMGGSGTNSFDSTTIYYLHAKIKRLNSNMTIYVKLANTANKNSPTQYLRTINIKGGNTSEWYDFEIIFKPIASDFDCIVFQLQRTNEDYTADGYRNLVILYEELSIVQNFKANLTENNIIKLGVQSRPGLLMCINGQEIHVGRNGIYEIRNGIVYVDFFSIIKAAEEEEGPIEGLYHRGENLEDLLDSIASGTKKSDISADDSEDTDSDCIFNHSKKRTINTFTIDYMYEVKDNNE